VRPALIVALHVAVENGLHLLDVLELGEYGLMVSLNSRSFPVIGSDGQLLGMISREDVMRALKESTRRARRRRSYVTSDALINTSRLYEI
jgi:CBS domain-containing protein